MLVSGWCCWRRLIGDAALGPERVKQMGRWCCWRSREGEADGAVVLLAVQLIGRMPAASGLLISDQYNRAPSSLPLYGTGLFKRRWGTWPNQDFAVVVGESSTQADRSFNPDIMSPSSGRNGHCLYYRMELGKHGRVGGEGFSREKSLRSAKALARSLNP
ncbi:uncharacterized protein BDR25DRAFT_393827 [Lindgomyces ingoldianus]|uniref:Uncharacterized protein n=1 Tax=Lindgomyces ingoldianus TaxID=673940 RepID=A0ACB6QTD7_9PLEO|nr:uncharacterized protein BDR25DRAFT_393827 [Lindgomyces ingoldianus]KAF2470264.1 hypothetical protein BDR25DRAFT_393827 [Lindgomyces ingoldianus]